MRIQGTWPHPHGTEIHIPDESHWMRDKTMHMHEYAHCVQYHVDGNRWPRSSHIGAGHSVVSELDGGFALCEGWAEFLPCAIQDDPNALSGHGGSIESNRWQDGSDAGDVDGNEVEGCVAGILWDIFDDADEPGVDWPDAGFDEIWTVISEDSPDDMHEFWDSWFEEGFGHRAELNHIYWDHGIDEDSPPVAYIVDPSTTRAHWASGPVTVTVNALDSDGYVESVGFYVYRRSTRSYILMGVDDDGSDGWSMTIHPEDLASTPLPDTFEAEVAVKAYDGMEWGDMSPRPRLRYEFQEPRITVNIRSAFTDAQVPTLEATVEDYESGLHLVVVGMMGGGEFHYCSGETTITVTGTTYVSLNPGTYTYVVTAVDTAGNTASESGTFTVMDDDDEPPKFYSFPAKVVGGMSG